MLETVFLGKELINPFILASAPPTKDKESIIKGFVAGWAGAVTKSVSESILVDKNPRIGHIKYAGKVIASQNYEMGSSHTLDYWADAVNEIKNEYPDRLLLISLFGGPKLDEWRDLAEYFSSTPADGYELNFSCPHADHEGKGSLIGQNPELCASLTRTVKETINDNKKIMIKLPYLSHPNEGFIASKCIDSGADAIAGINTIAGLSEIDINTFKPKLNTGSLTTLGGISGEIIRPFARASITNISKSIDYKKHQVSAMGGVNSKTESMVEYILLGATTLQVCTAVMNKGYNIIKDMEENLEEYLNELNVASLNNLVGKSLNNITTWDKLDSTRRISKIDLSKCVSCYSCMPYCNYDAIKNENDSVAVIDENCDGCGSCVSACKEEAIKLIEKS